jgi:hypothetical protein
MGIALLLLLVGDENVSMFPFTDMPKILPFTGNKKVYFSSFVVLRKEGFLFLAALLIC